MASPNRDLARTWLAAAAAFAALPLTKLPALASIDCTTVTGGQGIRINALTACASDDPAEPIIEVVAWSRALPEGAMHARPNQSSWRIWAAGELGTAPIEVWDLVDVDEQLAADLAAAADSAAAGALLVERLGEVTS